MLKNTSLNRKVIRKIALALGDLNEQVVFVGGATVSLYVNDPADDLQCIAGNADLILGKQFPMTSL